MRAVSLSLITVLACGLLSVSDRAIAQDAPPSQFEYIEGLQPFVGFWSGEISGGQAGGTVNLFCRLTSNRSYLQMQVSTQIEGERQTIATMLIGRDFANQQVSFWSFWADRQMHGKAEIGEGTARWSETGTRFDGQKSTANVAMKVDGDKLTVDVTDAKVGDEAQPEMHISFTRSQRPGRGGRGGQ